MSVECRIILGHEKHPRIADATFNREDGWSFKTLSRPEDMDKDTWEGLSTLVTLDFLTVLIQAGKEIDAGGYYPMDRERAIAAHAMRTAPHGRIVKEMDENLLYELE